MPSVIGGFAEGLTQGMKFRSDMDDAKQRRELLKKQDEREAARANREQQIFGFTIKDLARKENRAASEDEALRDLQSVMIGGGEEMPEAEESPAPARGIAVPAAAPGMAPEAAPAPQGIATPAQAAAAPAAPKAPRSNPFVTNMTPQQMDALYDAQTKALQRYYIAKGDPEKAFEAPKKMQELRDFNWTNKVGASLSGMVAGAPGARDAFSRVYGVVNDGYDLDPKSGQFDPKTNSWSGLVRINKETGEREAFNLTPEMATQMVARFKNPAEVIKYIDDKAAARRAEARDETRVANDTTRAKASVSEAGARWAQVGINARRADADARGADQKARVEALLKLFPNAEKELALDDKVGKDEKQIAAMEARIAADRTGYAVATNLASLNPKVDPRVIAGIGKMAAQGNLPEKKVDPQTGRSFIEYGGMKIFAN